MNVKNSNASRLQSEPVDAPKWYTSQELWEVLRRDESPHIANRLSVEYAKNLQMAFNKGYEMGSRKVAQKSKSQDEMPGSQQQVVMINGWGILHPDGRLELDYYHTELSFNQYGGPKLTPEQWMERYRPDCTLHRVTIELLSSGPPFSAPTCSASLTDRELAQEIIACLRVNMLRVTMTTQCDDQFWRFINAWSQGKSAIEIESPNVEGQTAGECDEILGRAHFDL